MLRIDALPFHEAIRAALARRVVLPDEFYGRLQAEARQVANTVSRLASIDQISAVLESLVDAERRGEGFRDWKRALLASTGGFGLTDAHLETIYRTNLKAHYAAGHAVSILKHADSHPFLQYSAIRDSRVRPEHAALHGIILPVTHPFWRQHFPPLAFNCRCSVIPLTAKQAERRIAAAREQGRTIDEPPVGEFFDPGWGYDRLNGSPGQGVIDAAARKAAKYPQLPKAGEALQLPVPTNPTTPAEAIERGKASLDELLTAFRTANKREMDLGSRPDRALFLKDQLLPAIRKAHGAPVTHAIHKIGGQQIRKARATWAEAMRRMPATWVAASEKFGRMTLQSSSGRAFSYTHEDPPQRMIRFQGGGSFRDVKTGDAYMRIPWNSVSTTIHEFVHRVQATLPSLDRIFAKYHAERTKGDKLVTLRSLFPRHRYGLGEVTLPDKFVEPYIGKVYYSDRKPLEMFTMAVEAVLGSDEAGKWRYDRFWTKDREFLELTIGLLLHWKP